MSELVVKLLHEESRVLAHVHVVQPLTLSPSERAELKTMARSRTVHAALVQRAVQLILALAEDASYAALRGCRRSHHRPAGASASWRTCCRAADRPRDGRGDLLIPA